ncbi:MAG: LysR family transcriptional regulator [Bdellovibrionota bacterium]
MYPSGMEWLNYHHLYYFWTVARLGSIARAREDLRLAQPTISAQIRALEKSLGEKLFAKAGRGLVLTEAGRVVYRYASEIFSLGRELQDTLGDRPAGRPLRLQVGVANQLPKLIAYRLLEPVLRLPQAVHLVCREDSPEKLLTALALHEFDVVLSDSPALPHVAVRAFSHLLGSSPVGIFGTPALAKGCRRGFPRSLEGAPVLWPTENTVLRRTLDGYFESRAIRPRIVAEFEDSALCNAYGAHGTGLFAAPLLIAKEIQAQYGAVLVGRLGGVKEEFFAISVERRLRHPGAIAIWQSARLALSKKPGRSNHASG